jgi:hypothetical protein
MTFTLSPMRGKETVVASGGGKLRESSSSREKKILSFLSYQYGFFVWFFFFRRGRRGSFLSFADENRNAGGKRPAEFHGKEGGSDRVG